MLSGLSMKLRQFGDKVHLAQELIPTFVFILFMVTLYRKSLLHLPITQSIEQSKVS